jgi:betaine-aldehyde dehydrogenase/aminobutyraldehyde dehydrogenase
VHLELGGKAPVIVFDDADLAAVAEGVRAAGYWNSGQDCTAASRIVAGPKIYDRLLEELVPAVESIKVADPAEGEDIEMGSVISKDQQERVFGFLERAEGATILTGGGSNGDRGFFVPIALARRCWHSWELSGATYSQPVLFGSGWRS